MRRLFVLWMLIAACTRPAPPPPPPPTPAPEPPVAAVRQAIHQTWSTLTRTHADLARAAADPKNPNHTGPWPVYVAADENLQAVRAVLQSALSPADMQSLDVRQLGTTPPREPGLLYLPHPYVVPGGRFNEMYGWDSYFIVLGLLRDGDLPLARHITDNFLYEVQHYGTVLNANRSYYLTRSQPPLLSRMVLAVHAQRPDPTWLRATVAPLHRYHAYWGDPLHSTPSGLSRYADRGRGPAAEVLSGEVDAQGADAYRRIKDYFKNNPVPGYDTAIFYDRTHDRLTDAFYAGDRAMRESGFDTSNRFGPFNAAVLDFNPVCLNALLYAMETDIASIHAMLGEAEEARTWAAKAEKRAWLINQLNWDEATGLYLDYDFRHGKRRDYPFATTFLPLWAGLAPAERAARVAANVPMFAAPGGLKTSPFVTGNQWDAPFGWAPMQLFAVQGLRRYGFRDPANRIAINFLSMVAQSYDTTHGLWEKYDVIRRAPGATQAFGYTSNEPGFGWTNGVFAELFATLSPADQIRVGLRDGIGVR